jgi:hypothetical protein
MSAPLPSRLAPHGPRVFVDRRVECAALSRAIEDVTASGPQAAIVTGDPGIGKTWPRDVTWLAVMCIYAQVAGQLELIPTAAMLYQLLEPWEAQVAFPAFGVWGPVGLHLGSLALCSGEGAAAARHLSRAKAQAAHAGAPLWETWADNLLSRLPETAR